MKYFAIAFIAVIFTSIFVLEVSEYKQRNAPLPKEENPQFAECEAGLKALLKSPSSYELIEKSIIGEAVGSEVRYIYIDYDAHNGYGTPLRSKFQCNFALKNSGYELTRVISDGKEIKGDQLFNLKIRMIASR